MQVKRIFAHNSLRNFIYFLVDEGKKTAICIDPYDSKIVLDFLKENQLSLTEIWNTHQHPDHIRGNNELIQKTDAEIRTPQAAEVRTFENGKSKVLSYLTPGHTMDHLCFHLYENEQSKALFCGDTLFHAGVGHCKLGGEPQILYQTICELKKMIPKETNLYVGHDYFETNLLFAQDINPSNSEIDSWLLRLKSHQSFVLLNFEEESKINPFLRLDCEEIRKNLHLDKNASDCEVFCSLRTKRDSW